VHYLTRAHICERLPQLHPNGAVIRDLILGHVNDDDSNSELCDVLLELDTSIMDCRDLMAAKELPHSRICLSGMSFFSREF
jgi:hypothetical protein